MNRRPDALSKMIDELKKFPGVGPKTAERLTFFLLKQKKEDALALADAIVELKSKTRLCAECSAITETEICSICADPERDPTTICVVEEPNDLFAFEKTDRYNGRYHVLMGALSPLDGIGPADIRIQQLIDRVSRGGAREVIIAVNPNIEGEATAIYIAKALEGADVIVSRIASGLPVGSDIEYADEMTLEKALTGRITLRDGGRSRSE